VTLRVPAGTPSGRTFRVKGRGVPAGKKSATGDLLVTVEVAVPGRADRRAARRGGGAGRGDRSAGARRHWGCEMTDERRTRAVYVISVAAELAGVHPQTLRVYERKGLLDPSRTEGGSRRFSEQDLDRLRHIQSLTNAGLNLEGVRRVLELEAEVARLQRELEATRAEAREAVAVTHRQYRRDLVPLSQKLPCPPARPTPAHPEVTEDPDDHQSRTAGP
jgi:MerR family transcriptional regulator/heat shock protein HspR